MGSGSSVAQKSAGGAEPSEFASYRDDFHKAKGEGISNHEIFDQISRARVALPDDGDKSIQPQKQSVRQARAGSHQHIKPQGSTMSIKVLPENPRRNSVLGIISHDTKKHRRDQIFEDGFDFTLAATRKEMAKQQGGFDKTKEVFQDGNDKLILEALVNFFFMGEDCETQMNSLINTMEKGTCRCGEWLMQEGEPGDAMYVIKSGKMEVYVGGSLTRHVGRGNAVGELALLYHTPRSASVKAIEDCELFTLQRSKFREMLALSVSASLVQRVAWMQATPELEPLDKQAASRLAGAFSTIQLRQGETVVAEGGTVDRCYLVEYGSVEVTSSTVESPDLVRKQLRPAVPTPDTPRPLAKAGSKGGSATATGLMEEKSAGARGGDDISSAAAATVLASRSGEIEGEGGGGDGEGGETGETDESKDGERAGEGRRIPPRSLILGPGTFLGMPVLLCAGKGKRGACWAAAPEPLDLGEGKMAEGSPEGLKFSGAVCPVSITAKEDLRLSYFTPSQFEAIVGPIREVFSQLLRGRPSLLKKAKSQRFIGKAMDNRFTPDDFKTEVFLGTGSFGRVTLVTFKDKAKQEDADLGEVEHFALKALAKKAVVERGQLAHVKDEKLLLQNMSHPLILGLFSTFQDANSIYFLMEAVTAGEMWSIIYEGVSGYGEGDLPIEHGRFYVACVLEALSYMHARGVAYRDLKPENIMVDGEGYPRLIDLGFAKKIPFTIVVDGKPEVHPKSFTMCGTPEYLAPEFIFNAGHDKSVDCWALGVLTFEYTAGYTPFQSPGEPADITALFTRIAGSKVATSKSIFPGNYDEKAGNEHSRDIVSRFLQADPTQRLGNLAGGIDEARKHPYFAEIDWNALAHKKMPAPWKPPSSLAPPAMDEGNHKDVPIFTGDNSLFANW
eukprot:g12406.t1